MNNKTPEKYFIIHHFDETFKKELIRVTREKNNKSLFFEGSTSIKKIIERLNDEQS